MSNGSIWVVYIIESQVTGNLYTGITNDMSRRLAAHNNGTGAKYTRTGRPWRVLYQEPVDDKSSALKRELKIKSLSRSQKLTLIRAQTLPQPVARAPRTVDDPPEPPLPATEPS
jgi:putative endonuclease